MEREVQAYRQAVRVLPQRLRREALTLTAAEQGEAEELRLRVGRPLTVVLAGEERVLGVGAVQPGELDQLVELASRASLHAVLEQVRQGYLTVEGGHRVGLCGSAALREGKLHSFRQISSASIRVARQVRGVADSVLGKLCREGQLESTLILAPPGAGKTTLLRDIIRKVSQGEDCAAKRVSLADERGEVAALWGGVPQLDVGSRTDVMEGCSKAQGLMLLLRAMNPQVLAADEITAPEDIEAFVMAAGCGAVLLATAHGAGREDLTRRGLYRTVLEEGLFRKLVLIRRRGRERYYVIEELS